MQIINVSATATVTSAKAEITKGVESLVFYSYKEFEAMQNEEIKIEVERNGGSNIEITQGFINLKKFVLAATYGDDAITCGHPDLDEPFKTIAVIELTELGALVLGPNDKLKIELKNLTPTYQYIIDGLEAPNEGDDVYMYETKSIPAEQTNYDLNVKGNDIAVFDDLSSIQEINLTYDNGVVCKYSIRELRAMTQDVDPVALINQDGQVRSGIYTVMQLPLKGITNINVRKSEGEIIKFVLRKDVDMVRNGEIKA